MAKYMYNFLRENASLIDELHEVLKHIKCNGLSKKTVDECMALVQQIIPYGERPKLVGDGIAKYFERELDMMSDTSILLSRFSDTVKIRCQRTKVSDLLLLSLRLCCSIADSLPSEDIERTNVNAVARWGKDFLLPSKMAKRKEILSA